MSEFVGTLKSESDPCWQLPVFVDQIRSVYNSMFADHIRAARAALERFDKESCDRLERRAELEIAVRSLRHALSCLVHPLSSDGAEDAQRDMLLSLESVCAKLARQRLHSSDDEHFDVEQTAIGLRECGVLVEMISSIGKHPTMLGHPDEKVVTDLSELFDACTAFIGDASMRERDEDVNSAVRLANLDLGKLALPMAIRLSEVVAKLHERRISQAAKWLRSM